MHPAQAQFQLTVPLQGVERCPCCPFRAVKNRVGDFKVAASQAALVPWKAMGEASDMLPGLAH